MFDVIQPKRPLDTDGWTQLQIGPDNPMAYSGYTAEAWQHSNGLLVISAVEVAEEEIGPEYHLSVSKKGARCSPEEGFWVCFAFGVPEAEEDNHVGGISRNYWRPVADSLAERICPCKSEEPKIVEDGGSYIWRP